MLSHYTIIAVWPQWAFPVHTGKSQAHRAQGMRFPGVSQQQLTPSQCRDKTWSQERKVPRDLSAGWFLPWNVCQETFAFLSLPLSLIFNPLLCPPALPVTGLHVTSPAVIKQPQKFLLWDHVLTSIFLKHLLVSCARETDVPNTALKAVS